MESIGFSYSSCLGGYHGRGFVGGSSCLGANRCRRMLDSFVSPSFAHRARSYAPEALNRSVRAVVARRYFVACPQRGGRRLRWSAVYWSRNSFDFFIILDWIGMGSSSLGSTSGLKQVEAICGKADGVCIP